MLPHPRDPAGSPLMVDARPGEDVQWWKPDARDVAANLGWRCLWFAPALAALFAFFLLPADRTWLPFLPVLWKPLLIAVFIPATMAIRATKNVVGKRTEPFCIHCGYSLVGLEDGNRCPECGRKFSLAAIEEYRRDPQWFIQRWKAMHNAPTRRDTPFDAGPIRRRKSRDGT